MNTQAIPQHKQKTMSGVRERIREVLTRDLDSNERLLVVLRFAERMTFCEIGIVLGMTSEQAEAKLDSLVGRMQMVA